MGNKKDDFLGKYTPLNVDAYRLLHCNLVEGVHAVLHTIRHNSKFVRTNPKCYIKGTVRVISSDPPFKDGNTRLKTVPLNLKLIKNKEDTVVFLTL